MMKILQRPRVLTFLIIFVLILLLSTLPIDNLLLSFLGFIVSTLPMVKLLIGLGLFCLIALLFIIISTFLQRVPENYVDIVTSFGSYGRTLYPGINIRLPWEKIAGRLRVSESLMVCPPQVVPLSYDYDVILSCAMSYQLVPEHAHLAISIIENWEKFLYELLVTTLQASGTVFEPGDFLAWVPRASSNATSKSQSARVSPWERVNLYLLGHMREVAQQWGVQVNWTAIRDVKLAKHATALVIKEQSIGMLSEIELAENPREHNYPTEKLTPRPLNGQLTASGKWWEVALNSSESGARVFDENVLIQAYAAVQNGNITDPQTVRKIAARFEGIAQDPQVSKMVSFDAAQAADILYKRASMYEGDTAQAHKRF